MNTDAQTARQAEECLHKDVYKPAKKQDVSWNSLRYLFLLLGHLFPSFRLSFEILAHVGEVTLAEAGDSALLFRGHFLAERKEHVQFSYTLSFHTRQNLPYRQVLTINPHNTAHAPSS